MDTLELSHDQNSLILEKVIWSWDSGFCWDEQSCRNLYSPKPPLLAIFDLKMSLQYSADFDLFLDSLRAQRHPALGFNPQQTIQQIARMNLHQSPDCALAMDAVYGFGPLARSATPFQPDPTLRAQINKTFRDKDWNSQISHTDRLSVANFRSESENPRFVSIEQATKLSSQDIARNAYRVKLGNGHFVQIDHWDNDRSGRQGGWYRPPLDFLFMGTQALQVYESVPDSLKPSVFFLHVSGDFITLGCYQDLQEAGLQSTPKQKASPPVVVSSASNPNETVTCSY